jgi:hypothetical protein
MPSLEDARKHRNTHHRHPHGGLTPPPHHTAGSPHPPAHSSAPKNTTHPATPPQRKRADSKNDKPMVTPAAAPLEPLPIRAGSVAYRPSPRRDGGSSGPDLGHSFKASPVRLGDSLWGIAKRKLGSGHRWREIHTARGSRLIDIPKTKRESGIQRYTPTAKKTFDSRRPTALSFTARRSPGGQSNSWISTTAGSSRTKHESNSQRNSPPPASWAGFPVLTAQVTHSRVSQVHHVATRVGVPMAEAQSSAALAGGMQGAVLLNPSAVNPFAEAFGSTQVRGAAKGAFKVLAPIGIAVDAVQLRGAWKKDHGFGPNVRHVAGSAAGGWVGAAGGVELGAAIGSLVPGVGTVIGALVGGMAGAVAGSRVGEEIVKQGEESF